MKSIHKSPALKVKHKYKLIPKHARLEWLQKQITLSMDSRVGSIEKFREYKNKRNAFSRYGPSLRENQPCYVCCTAKAVLRHHIVPLILGGRSKFNNLAPLCNDCHTEVHKVGPREPTIVIPDTDPGVIRIKNLLRSMYA